MILLHKERRPFCSELLLSPSLAGKVVNRFGGPRSGVVSALGQSVSTWAFSTVSFSSDSFFQQHLKELKKMKKMSVISAS
jgi:hypothetical protein